MTNEAMLQAGWISPSEPRIEQPSEIGQEFCPMPVVGLVEPLTAAQLAAAEAFDVALVAYAAGLNRLLTGGRVIRDSSGRVLAKQGHVAGADFVDSISR